MKRYGFYLLCCATFISLNAMEKSQEIWDASCAAKSDKQYQEQVISDLTDLKINLVDKFVLDACCGTGNHSYFMAQKVGKNGLVLGVDASKSMIDWAKKQYKGQENLSFYQCDIKNFDLSQSNKNQFNIATLFNSYDLLDDKLAACKAIYKNLQDGGDLLINVGPGCEPLDIQVSREMIRSIPLMGSLLSRFGIENVFLSSYSTEQEYKDNLQEAGFEIIDLVKKQRCLIFDSKEDFAAIKRPIAQSRPIVRSISSLIFEYAFNNFITIFVDKLEKNKQNQLIYRFNEILIHARKSDQMATKTIGFLHKFAGSDCK